MFEKKNPFSFLVLVAITASFGAFAVTSPSDIPPAPAELQIHPQGNDDVTVTFLKLDAVTIDQRKNPAVVVFSGPPGSLDSPSVLTTAVFNLDNSAVSNDICIKFAMQAITTGQTLRVIGTPAVKSYYQQAQSFKGPVACQLHTRDSH